MFISSTPTMAPIHHLQRLSLSKCRSCRHITTSTSREASRRVTDFNSGFTGSYDPSTDQGRGPMFDKINFGVPQFYPRDLKKRVDDYVVGQERAKKTICSTIFNHYQNVRRRHKNEHEDKNSREKIMRQRFAREREMHQRRRDNHPTEGWSIVLDQSLRLLR